MPQGTACSRDIVPVSTTSASDEGQGAALTAGAAPRRTTAHNEGVEEEVLLAAEVIPSSAHVILGDAELDNSQDNPSSQIAATPVNANNESWVNLVEEEEKRQMQLAPPMEIDNGEVISTSIKRKARHTIDSDSDEMKAPDFKIREAKVIIEKLRSKSKVKTSCNVIENSTER